MARKRKKMNQKNEKIEKREFAFDVTATEEGNHITGRPIVYNAPTIVGGIFREVFEPGALNKTDLKDVPLLVGHDRSAIPVARSTGTGRIGYRCQPRRCQQRSGQGSV